MSDREFWAKLDDRMKAHREKQERRAERRARECMADMCALMVANQWKKKPKKRGKV